MAITYEMLDHRVLLNEAQIYVVETGSESEELDVKSAKWSPWAAVSAGCWAINKHASAASQLVSSCNASSVAQAGLRYVA